MLFAALVLGLYAAALPVSRWPALLLGLPIGLPTIVVPLRAYLKSLNTIYAITNQRVMIISGGGTRAVKSLIPADILGVDYRERPDGTGDVLIRTPQGIESLADFKALICLYRVHNVREVAEQVMRLCAQRPDA